MTAEPGTLAQLVEARKEAVAGLLIAAMSRDHTAQSFALEALINLGQVNLIAASPLLIRIAAWDRETQSNRPCCCELIASMRLCAGGESCRGDGGADGSRCGPGDAPEKWGSNARGSCQGGRTVSGLAGQLDDLRGGLQRLVESAHRVYWQLVPPSICSPSFPCPIFFICCIIL